MNHTVIYDALLQIDAGALSISQAALSLGLHRSTLQRKLARVRSGGASALIHRLKGRPSNRRLPDDVRARVIEVARQLAGARLTDIHKNLSEVHGLRTSYATLTRWLRMEEK
jgi:transposase